LINQKKTTSKGGGVIIALKKHVK